MKNLYIVSHVLHGNHFSSKPYRLYFRTEVSALCFYNSLKGKHKVLIKVNSEGRKTKMHQVKYFTNKMVSLSPSLAGLVG